MTTYTATRQNGDIVTVGAVTGYTHAVLTERLSLGMIHKGITLAKSLEEANQIVERIAKRDSRLRYQSNVYAVKLIATN